MNGRINQAYEAAQLYYVQDMTMDGIANRLGVSRATVSRLLKSARETGMVQIRLDDSFRVRSELERRISERYKTRVSLVNTRADATPIAEQVLGWHGVRPSLRCLGIYRAAPSMG